MNKDEMAARIAQLEQKNQQLEHELAAEKNKRNTINGFHQEVLDLLNTRPMTISEIAEEMNRDNRTISQYIHVLKSRHGFNIITLSDGRKQLILPETPENPALLQE